MIQGIILQNKIVIVVSDIKKSIQEDYGGPDLDVTNPYVLQTTKNTNDTSAITVRLRPFLSEYTDQKVFSFRSEDILTMFTPNENIIEEFKRALGISEQLKFNILNEDEDYQEDSN